MRTLVAFTCAAVLGVLACGSHEPAGAGSASPSDAALLDEMRGFADRLKRELTETIGVIDSAHGDCAKAAAGLAALAPARQETVGKGKDLMARLRSRPGLEGQVRTIMDSAFPQDVRDRADAVIDPMQAKCADDPAFQAAMQKSGYPKKKKGP
jgi:hypothetical protein